MERGTKPNQPWVPTKPFLLNIDLSFSTQHRDCMSYSVTFTMNQSEFEFLFLKVMILRSTRFSAIFWTHHRDDKRENRRNFVSHIFLSYKFTLIKFELMEIIYSSFMHITKLTEHDTLLVTGVCILRNQITTIC